MTSIRLTQSQLHMCKLHPINQLQTNTLTKNKGSKTSEENAASLARTKFCSFKTTTHFQTPLKIEGKVQNQFSEAAKKYNPSKEFRNQSFDQSTKTISKNK